MWKTLALIGAMCNLADGILTAQIVERGLTTEANPLLAGLMAGSMPAFFAFKLYVVFLFYFLAKHQNNKLARIGILLGTLPYICIVLLEMYCLR